MVLSDAAKATVTVATGVPLVSNFLGYDFEAGSMLAALSACGAVRFYFGARDPAFRWKLDLPISALSLMVAAASVISQRPEPLPAIMLGISSGVAGLTLIRLAEKRWQQLAGAEPHDPNNRYPADGARPVHRLLDPVQSAPGVGRSDEIEALVEQLNKLPAPENKNDG